MQLTYTGCKDQAQTDYLLYSQMSSPFTEVDFSVGDLTPVCFRWRGLREQVPSINWWGPGFWILSALLL